MTTRTGEDTNRVVSPRRRSDAFGVAPPVGVIPGSRGVGKPAALASSGGGGGGSGLPWIEEPYTGSQWHTVVSSDGLFVMQFPVYSDFVVANGAVGRLTYAAP